MKVREWTNIYCANGCQKKARAVRHKSDKTDFQTETVTRDKVRHCTIKGTIQQDDIIIVNIYALKYINQLIKNIKEIIDSNTVIVGDFNTPDASMDG